MTFDQSGLVDFPQKLGECKKTFQKPHGKTPRSREVLGDCPEKAWSATFRKKATKPRVYKIRRIYEMWLRIPDLESLPNGLVEDS